jgi:hypothetical protein
LAATRCESLRASQPPERCGPVPRARRRRIYPNTEKDTRACGELLHHVRPPFSNCACDSPTNLTNGDFQASTMERGSIQRPPDPGICFVTRVEGHLQTLVRIAKVTFSREQRRQWPAADFARALPLERRGWSLSPSMSSLASSPTASGPTGRRSPRLAPESCSTRNIKSASSSASSPTTGPAGEIRRETSSGWDARVHAQRATMWCGLDGVRAGAWLRPTVLDRNASRRVGPHCSSLAHRGEGTRGRMRQRVTASLGRKRPGKCRRI